jgi:F-type H+-transporting ATPase subunit b
MSAESNGAQLAESGTATPAAAVATEATVATDANATGHEQAATETVVAQEAPAATETHTEVAQVEAGAHGDAGGLPPFLRFDPGVWIWTVLVFVTLLLILRKMAWKPILESIDKREKTINDSLEQASRIQEESKRITEEQNRILAQARTDANAMMQSSKQAAEDLRRKLEQSAQEEKARIIASANQEIEASKRAAITELRKTTADLSIRIAEKLIQANLDDSKQRALVDQLISEVSRN